MEGWREKYLLQYACLILVVIILAVLLIIMIYKIRSLMALTRGPYSWISNFCIYTLFMVIILSVFLGLASFTLNYHDEVTNPTEGDKESGLRRDPTSEFISKFCVFPIVVIQAFIYICLNINLVWMWYTSGELNTIINKFIFLQRFWGIIYNIGSVLDFQFRLFGTGYVAFMSQEDFCASWMIFYKFLFYAIMSAQFAVSLVRYACIAYPIDYHNR